MIHELRLDRSVRRLPWISLPDISPALQTAAIASEDRRFYGMGASTVGAGRRGGPRVIGGPARRCQHDRRQVATPAPRRSDAAAGRRRCGRSGVRWVGPRLEAVWTKAEILEAYLNRVTFRAEVQGVGAAAFVFFGKARTG